MSAPKVASKRRERHPSALREEGAPLGGADRGTVFIGLGSNISAEKNLREAARLLRNEWPSIVFSSVYESAPLEVADQPSFLNAVAKIETEDEPEAVLRKLQSIESNLGKSPLFRYGPRTIDLDLLLFKNKILPSKLEWNKIVNCQFLAPRSSVRSEVGALINCHVVPHPKMHARRFVLEPLCELIEPTIKHPMLHEAMKILLEKANEQSCHRCANIVLP